jgi:hypothetical protein
MVAGRFAKTEAGGELARIGLASGLLRLVILTPSPNRGSSLRASDTRDAGIPMDGFRGDAEQAS